MESKLPQVGVVTVTYNSGQVLPDFLDSMANQQDVDVRLYAIDNNSHDDSVAQLTAEARADHLTIVANDDNLGVAVGNNQGIELALRDECDWVLLLNNDTVLPSDALSILVRDAEAHNLDILAPLIEATDPPETIWYSDGHFVPSQGYRTFHDTTGHPISNFPTRLTKTGYASTCCLLVRPKVFFSVGLMDPIYFVYFDDVDFAVRAVARGFQYWVTPNTRIIHKASSLTGGKSSSFTVKWVSRNWALIARRHLGRARGAYALGFIQAWMLARLLVRKDSMATYSLRQKSFRDGYRAALAPPPPRAPTEGLIENV